jgi:hypothetical protein
MKRAAFCCRGPFLFICDIFGISEGDDDAVLMSKVRFRTGLRSPRNILDELPRTSEVGMTKQGAQVDEREARMGRRVSGKVSVLLTEIEKEEVPDRLLELARKLQDALNEKLGG